MDIAKPEWEKSTFGEEIYETTNKFENTESFDDYNEPYGKWKSPLELDSVPFSRSADGKPIRWKLLTTTSKVRGGIPTKGSKEAIANPSIPLIVVNRENVKKKDNPKTPNRPKKRVKSRRISKRVRNKERKRKIQDGK